MLLVGSESSLRVSEEGRQVWWRWWGLFVSVDQGEYVDFVIAHPSAGGNN